MVVRRADSRRRRIMVDPAMQNQSIDAADSSQDNLQSGKKPTLYADGAQRRYQSKTTDLIPKRPLVVIGLFIGLVGMIAILNALAYFSTHWEAWLGKEGIEALQLTGRSTLSAWFTSVLLVISGFASLQIYALRQHRRDDYRGSYRLWLWITLLLLIASANCVVDLSTTATNFLQFSTNTDLTTAPVWWVMVQLSLLMLLIARGIYEIRESKGTIALVTLVWVSYTAAILLKLPANERVFSQIDTVDKQTVLGNLGLIGTASMAAGILLFARFVYLQALGLIAVKLRTKKSKAKKKAQAVKQKAKVKTAKPKAAESKPAADSTDAEEGSDTAKTTAGKLADDAKRINAAPGTAKDSANGNRDSRSTNTENISKIKPSAKPEQATRPAVDDDQAILKLTKRELKQQKKDNRSGRRAA